MRIAVVLMIGYITYSINSMIPFNGILEIIVRSLTCLAIIIPVFFVLYRKNSEARIIFNTLKIAFTKNKTDKEDSSYN